MSITVHPYDRFTHGLYRFPGKRCGVVDLFVYTVAALCDFWRTIVKAQWKFVYVLHTKRPLRVKQFLKILYHSNFFAVLRTIFKIVTNIINAFEFVRLIRFQAWTTQPMFIKCCVHVVRSTEKEYIGYFSSLPRE